MSTIIKYPAKVAQIPVYASASLFPVSAMDGSQAIAADTDTIYLYNVGTSSWVAVATPGAAIALDALTGDVTATGPGVAPATVVLVGGSTASAVHTATVAVTAATNSDTPSTIVKRDGSGNFATNSITLDSTTANTVLVSNGSKAIASVTTASDGQVLTLVSGSPAWAPPTGGSGTVTAVSASPPLSVSNPTSTPAITITQANTSTNGYLSNTDWNTFNGKQSTLTLGNLTSPTTGVSIGSGTGAVIGSGSTISVQTASGSQPGLLSSTDWNTFNGKQAAITVAAFSGSSLTNGATLSAGSLTFGPADATNPGMVKASGSQTLNATLTLAQTVTTSASVVVGTRITSGVVALVDGSTPALDASLGNTFTLSTTTTPTIAVPSNPVSGQKIVIQFLASGGARTLALNTGAGGFRFGTDITALTSTTSGKTDYIGCIYNAGASFWDVVAYVKGF